MGQNKTLYVRKDEVHLWHRAEEYARAEGISLSALTIRALRAQAATGPSSRVQQGGGRS